MCKMVPYVLMKQAETLLKCRGIWLSPVFGVRYIPLQCPAIVSQHTWGPHALVPLFRSRNVLVKFFTGFSLTLPRFLGKNPSGATEIDFGLILHPIALCMKSSGPAQHPHSSLVCNFQRISFKSSWITTMHFFQSHSGVHRTICLASVPWSGVL